MAKFRNECKHYVTELELIGLRQRLNAVAKKDRFSTNNGGYLIKSLYFDNCYDKALNEKLMGVANREKFRIRFYNNDTSYIRLEKKSKIKGLCLKKGTRLSAEQVQALLDGEISWMTAADDELIYELWAKMQYQMLRPKNIVVYDREAYVYNPGNVRVTIDSNIRGSDNVQRFLMGDEVDLRLIDRTILEVKWDEFLPQIIRDAVQLNDVKTSAFSKYAATRFSAF